MNKKSLLNSKKRQTCYVKHKRKNMGAIKEAAI